MATPFPGKTYRFKCFGTSKRLNLYSSGTASNGMNVVLYTPDDTREQQWLYSNGRLYIKTNTAFCLDRFTGSAAPDNADIYTASSADANEQLIVFEEVSGYTNCVKIRLTHKVNDKYYYLTAYNTQNGTGSGKSKTSAGNVFWRTAITSDLQMWTFEEVEETATGGLGNGTLTEGQRPSTLNYSGGCYTRFDAGQCTWHAFGRAKEVTGKTIEFSMPDGLHGKYWWQYVTNCSKSSTPVSNSIAVWDDGGKWGHVGYVEKVSGSTVYLTEANWPVADHALDAEDGKVRIRTVEQMKKRGASNQYELLGYLVL